MLTLNGKGYVNSDTAMTILGIEKENNFYQKHWRDRVNHGTIWVKSNKYYEYQMLQDILAEDSYREWFLKQVQSLLLFVMDETVDLKQTVSKKLGFNHPNSMRKFLELDKRSKLTAHVFVRLCKRYRPLVNRYDIEYF